MPRPRLSMRPLSSTVQSRAKCPARCGERCTRACFFIRRLVYTRKGAFGNSAVKTMHLKRWPTWRSNRWQPPARCLSWIADDPCARMHWIILPLPRIPSSTDGWWVRSSLGPVPALSTYISTMHALAAAYTRTLYRYCTPHHSIRSLVLLLCTKPACLSPALPASYTVKHRSTPTEVGQVRSALESRHSALDSQHLAVSTRQLALDGRHTAAASHGCAGYIGLPGVSLMRVEENWIGMGKASKCLAGGAWQRQ